MTLDGAGDCVVTATAESTDNYNQATADFTVTVAKGEQTLTGFAYSPGHPDIRRRRPDVDGPHRGAGHPLVRGERPPRCARSNATSGALTLDGAGDCVVTATAESTDNYNQATADFTVTVAKGEQTLTGFAYSPGHPDIRRRRPDVDGPHRGAGHPLVRGRRPPRCAR